MEIFSDSSFWVAVAFVLFVLALIYFRVPGRITEALDARSAQIAQELDEARKLREEAQALLANYQRKQRDAEQEAEDIVTQARAEAERLAAETRENLTAQLERRTKQAEDKIAQAEAQAVKEVKDAAATVAASAARRIISERIDEGRDAQMIDQDIHNLGTKLN